MNAVRDQLLPLTRTFFARFFESDITRGTDDLKGSYFWLLASLTVPGLFIPWIMAFEWQLLGRIQGAEAVRIASRAEKAFSRAALSSTIPMDSPRTTSGSMTSVL